jgi:3-phenylpropionate/cinnamic acid dioxygenase small subunit
MTVPSYEQIRNLLARYTQRIDEGDFAGVAALFTEAAFEDWDGNTIRTGAADIEEMYSSGLHLYDGRPGTKHVTTNTEILVDEDGGTATARSAYVVFQATPTLALQPIITGRYEDRFCRDDDGAWHFRVRRFGVDSKGDLSQHLGYAVPD